MKDRIYQAEASVHGGNGYPRIRGTVRFRQLQEGVLVTARLWGLPTASGACDRQIFALHIHSGESCAGDDTNDFSRAGTHYDPGNCPHPDHAGDLPPVFGCGDRAYCSFLTDRFQLSEVVGRVVILHRDRDDFTTQPSGGAGKMIACGVSCPRLRHSTAQCTDTAGHFQPVRTDARQSAGSSSGICKR